MDWQTYRTILQRLPIENPTQKDMAQLCPHLTKKQATSVLGKTPSFIACPPLLVEDSFQIIAHFPKYTQITKEAPNEETIIHSPQLRLAHAGRVPIALGDAMYSYMKEAMQFAQKNWGKKLVKDNWKSALQIFVHDVNALTRGERPAVQSILYIVLNRFLEDILKNTTNTPKSKLLDDAISQITRDPLIWNELIGKRISFLGFNCAHCGSGLQASHCPGCDKLIQNNSDNENTWSISLSEKMKDIIARKLSDYQWEK